MRKYFNGYKISMAILAFSIVFTIFRIYSFVTEQSPIYYEGVPFQLENNEVMAGDSIVFDVTRCTTKDNVTYTFNQRLVSLDNGAVTYLPSGFIYVEKAGYETVRSIPKDIPSSVEPGRYRFVFDILSTGRYKDFNVSLPSQDFTVLSHEN